MLLIQPYVNDVRVVCTNISKYRSSLSRHERNRNWNPSAEKIRNKNNIHSLLHLSIKFLPWSIKFKFLEFLEYMKKLHGFMLWLITSSTVNQVFVRLEIEDNSEITHQHSWCLKNSKEKRFLHARSSFTNLSLMTHQEVYSQTSPVCFCVQTHPVYCPGKV